MVKHTVTVYAWPEESEPVAIQDFQEGLFICPYFPLSWSVLSGLSLAGTKMRIQRYRKSLGNWVTKNFFQAVKDLYDYSEAFYLLILGYISLLFSKPQERKSGRYDFQGYLQNRSR